MVTTFAERKRWAPSACAVLLFDFLNPEVQVGAVEMNQAFRTSGHAHIIYESAPGMMLIGSENYWNTTNTAGDARIMIAL
jgi:hypothetical protein